MASRLQRLCAELGWFSLERLIKNFKPKLQFDQNLSLLYTECHEVFQCEGVNGSVKIVAMLKSIGIKTWKDLVMFSHTHSNVSTTSQSFSSNSTDVTKNNHIAAAARVLATKLQLLSGFTMQVCASFCVF